MPTVSPAQHRLMEAAAHTEGGYGGVPQSVGKEFVGKDAEKGIADRVKLLDSRLDAAEQRDLRRGDAGGLLTGELFQAYKKAQSDYYKEKDKSWQRFGEDQKEIFKKYGVSNPSKDPRYMKEYKEAQNAHHDREDEAFKRFNKIEKELIAKQRSL